MSASATSAPHAKPVAVLDDGARERRGVALMVAGGLLLGTIGVFVEEAAQHPLTTVWFRCVFGGGRCCCGARPAGVCTSCGCAAGRSRRRWRPAC